MLGMQKFLKRNWKQASEAADNYLNGVNVNAASFGAASKFFQDAERRGITGDALHEAVMAANNDVREGMVLGRMAHDITGSNDVLTNGRAVLNMADNSGMINVTGINNVAEMRSARGYSVSSDLQAAGAIAAAGVIGFSAVAGAANLVRGED